jgi:hypothetical protein
MFADDTNVLVTADDTNVLVTADNKKVPTEQPNLTSVHNFELVSG